MSLDSIAQPHALSLGNIRPGNPFVDPLMPKDLLPMPSLSSSMSAPKRKRTDDDSHADQDAGKQIKKAASSASLHMHDHDDDCADDSEKKRNKLGYHRTSVACGHCRRRKIRCMMPDDDPTGRCSNCIRLKKECNFYPVDQSTKGPHPSARAVSMPKGALRSQSPAQMYLPSSSSHFAADYPYAGHSSFSVPPPDTTTGLGLFNTSSAAAADFSAYDAPVTTWESSPYAALPTMGGPAGPYDTGLSPLSASPVPQSFTRPSSTFRPSPFADSAYGSVGSSKADVNEVGWSQRPYSPADGRRSASIPAPPSLVLGGDASSTPTLSEPSTIAPLNTMMGSAYWPNPWTPIPGTEPLGNDAKLFTAEPYDAGSWFQPDPINSY